ncbi:5'-nucleotidase C-terminal domain-containing protein, partial [Bordetella hinzii]|nr:5'-nucleotidase C-terminal domain-containing protein [Bordetella hinzii]
VHQRGGDIQQLVAQAYLEVANANYGGADISLQSGGGVRIALPAGAITAAKVIEVVPFGNMLWRLDVTGAEVKAMLEDGMQAVFGPGGTTGPYPYAGGLRWDVDSTQTQGNRVSNIEVYDRPSATWLPLDAARRYKLFVLSFNATGGDGYRTLANVPAERRQDIGVRDADVLQAYIDMQPRDGASQLPILRRLPHSLYSTKRFTE